MEPSSVNPNTRQSTEGLDRRDFLKGASVIGGSLMTGGLVASPGTASAEVADRSASGAGVRPRPPRSAPLTSAEQEVLGLIRTDRRSTGAPVAAGQVGRGGETSGSGDPR
jgi:hypothetical protein